MSSPQPRPLARVATLLLALTLTLTACTAGVAPTIGSTPAPAPAASPVAFAPSPVAPPSPTAAATAATPAAASPAAVAATPGIDEAALQAVVQRANDEQQRAFAAHDPTIMRDTATAAYYAELARTNSQLAASGVTAIALVSLEWGPIAQPAAARAQVTTFETWRTTYADGSTDQARERNVYTLVREAGAWTIQADEHPDAPAAPTLSSPGGAPSTAPIPTVPLGPGQSRNWAGYAATGGKFTAVTATWTVPQVNPAGGAGADATWIGIGGEVSRDLIQAGTDAEVSGGRVRYTAWIELLPQNSRQVALVVNPGDRITVSITLQAGNAWVIAFQNETTGQSYQEDETYTSSFSSGEWVEEASTIGRRIAPLDDFGVVQFEQASAVVDGRQVTIAQAGAKPITLVDRAAQPLATPSPLGNDGASFTVQRTPVAPASPAPAPAGGFAPIPVAAALRRLNPPLVA